MRTTLIASAKPRLALTRILLASAAAAAVGLSPALAAAQNDITEVLPNVLLLLDTSGSMEYLIHTGTDGVSEILPESSDANAATAACTVTTNCVPGNPASCGTTPTLNKWASLVSVLTGSFQPGAFGCQTVNRNSAAFVSEYGMPPVGTKPYDYNYFLPWHRIYSNGCTIGALQPMLSTQDWTNWGSQPYDYHIATGTSANSSANKCNWTGQNNDGILDIFSGLARFGMMTLDTLPDPGTGSVLGTTQINSPTATAGNWSYYHHWRSVAPAATPLTPAGNPNGNRPAAGNPPGCSTYNYVEVGARNPAAPPWEGPMVPFGDPTSDTGVAQNNAKIQMEILSMRPFGATPVAGLVDDANEFLFNDADLMPGQSGASAIAFGPSGPNPDGSTGDPAWKAGCRKTFMILLTDGMPNLDLRGPTNNPANATNCNNATGSCPYPLPETTLYNMRVNPPTTAQSVTTYVVGFAMSAPAALALVNPSYTSCTQLTPADCTSTSLPAPVQACCELQKLATAGAATTDPVFLPGNDPVTTPHATPHAFFADTAGELKQVLATILTQGIGKRTARTTPVYAPAPGNAAAQGNLPNTGVALSYHFAASFNVTSSANSGNVAQGGGANGLWSGNLVRERYACNSTGVVGPVTPDLTKGDDFAHNLDNNPVSTRNFFTAIGPTVSNQINSDWTIRPNLTVDDGFGLSTPVPAPPSPQLTTGSSFPTLMANYPTAFGVAATGDANCNSAFGIPSQPQNCVSYAVNWAIGGDNTALGSTAVSRDPTSTYCTSVPNLKCSRLGAIYHSTPVVVGPPREFLRDDTYTAYANSTPVSVQPEVLYVATMDGQLHAFKVSSTATADTPYVDTDSVNNELWSFFPPAVLQHLLPNFNTGGANLLDGTPVIADVPGYSAVGTTPPIFTRTPATTPVWHRVLVGSGGAAGGFYYALDITNPYAPTFLWQMSTSSAGNPIFGSATPSPAITIVAINVSGTRTQVPVAILPGGTGTQASSCPTPPAHPSTSNITLNDPSNPSNTSGAIYSISNFNAPPLRCWSTNGNNSQGNSGVGNFHNGSSATGNSITIVRLDTGAVLQNFTGVGYYGWVGNGQPGDLGNHASTATTQTTLPMSAPIVGTPAVYPSQTGQVADHAYVGDADGQLWRIDLSNADPTQWTVTLAWDAYFDSSATTIRDQAELTPVVSTDPVGNLVVAYATGDQNLLTTQSSSNRVWSLTETPTAHTISQNWAVKFSPSQGHVTGPMALFNNVLYFSTFVPLATPICNPGTANVFGVDYRRPMSPAGATPGAPIYSFTGPGAADGTVIMGVSATELPSCGGSQTTQDPYFGSHTQVTSANESVYRIMWQTGAGSGLSASGIQSEGGVQGMQNMTIPPPGQATRIDSWAAIVE
jgi:type IV pilus assembly protein PilY1